MLGALAARIIGPLIAKAAEGQYRPGPYYLPVTGGWLSAQAGQFWNWWQCGFDVQSAGTSAVVEACISSYAQSVAICPGTHWRLLANGGRERVTTSALSRILRRPNSYQTPPDFLLNLTDSLYREGNGYALALRNDRFEIDSLHLMNPRSSGPRVAANGELFYSLSGNAIIDQALDDDEALAAVPARDVLHVKLKTRREGDQLRGESPLVGAAMDFAASSAIAQQAIRFYLNQSRPSGILTTEAVLTEQQMAELRAHFDEKTKGLGVGGTPIFSRGVEWQATETTNRDSQLAEIMGYSDKRIAAVYRVPLALLNLGPETTQGSTEMLMNFWIATGLGFALNHIEESFGKTFGLAGLPSEYLEFDTAALLRSLFKDRVDAYARAVQAGITAPNEARDEFELGKAANGDAPIVQQQMVPLGWWKNQPPPGASNGGPPAGDQAPPADEADEGDPEDANRAFADLIRAAADRYETIRP